MAFYGMIEAGGTKFVCAVGSGPEAIKDEISLPTTTPAETLSRTAEFFEKCRADHGQQLDAIGIGTFGPADLARDSTTYGYITTTPKPGWAHTQVAGYFQQRFGVPVGFDTDVNAAAYGEYLWGAGRGLEVLVYLTVGTGIGGGVFVHGRPLHGLMHPEMGHVLVHQDTTRDPYEGFCPYHKNCLEGLASGKAVDLRWGRHASELPPDHPAWDLEAEYLGKGLANFILTLSPQRIILGGGLMHNQMLYPKIRRQVLACLNGYVAAKQLTEDIDNYIVSPGLGTRSGICGALGLAMRAAEE